MEIKATKVPVEEQETIIGWLRGDTFVTLSVSDNTTLTKIKKLAEKCPDQVKIDVFCKDADGNPTEYKVTLPRKCIRFAIPTRKRQLTDEQRQSLAERMKKARSFNK